MKKVLKSAPAVTLALLVCWGAFGAGAPARAAAQAAPEQERVAKNKQTILSRLKREQVEYRGDGLGLRFKSEWVDKMVRDYTHQKLILAGELSMGEKYVLSTRWLFKDMKVTFQELFNLGEHDDERLLPLSFGDDLLNLIPAYSFEGLTIYGKGGEVKGPYKRSTALAGPSLALANRGTVEVISAVIFPIYTNREGKEKIALGLARDAYTVKWKDVKNRVVDDMSESAYIERLKLLRDYASEDQFKELH